MRWLWPTLVATLVAAPVMAQGPFDADGYRSGSYRAPVELDPAPAARLALDAARGLRPGRDALFIDVLPAPGASYDAAAHRWRLTEPHDTIAGAVWWPEAGRSEVSAPLWDRVRADVARFRRHHPGAPIVVFCRTDCWMSWNAARHLARDGMAGVWWLVEGIEGWHAVGGTLVPATPR